MPRHYIDLTGQRFGRLAVIAYAGISPYSGGAEWKVRCDCGTVFIAQTKHLRDGGTRSCGCLRAEMNRDRAKKKK